MWCSRWDVDRPFVASSYPQPPPSFRRFPCQTSKLQRVAVFFRPPVPPIAAAPAVLRGATVKDDPVRVGHIGTGTRGWSLIRGTGKSESAKVVAVCDVYKPHVERGVEAARNDDVKTYVDYRDLLADENIEAVVIATPDHWHEQMVLDAVAAGKAVYCEKGLTMSVDSAKRMRAAVKKANTVFQLGHQGRQFPAYEAAGK